MLIIHVSNTSLMQTIMGGATDETVIVTFIKHRIAVFFFFL